MKIPTIKQVEEYFKDAITIRGNVSVYKDKIYTPLLDTIEFDIGKQSIYSDCVESFTDCCLWSEEKGYAEILIYKQEKFEITKEQILDIYENGVSRIKIKEMFPKIFEKEDIKLEINKWYWYNDCLLCFQGYENEYLTAFGFLQDKSWMILSNVGNDPHRWTQATEEEVFEALEKEAFKKGFGKKGIYFKAVNGEEDISNIEGINFYNRNSTYDSTNKFNIAVCTNYGVIYREGEWAEVIPTTTKKEAEKKLGAKIID